MAVPSTIASTDDPAALASAHAVLVAVKAAQTPAAAQALAGVLSPNCPVVSFQNGLRNAARLRPLLGERVVPAVIVYNVRVLDDGTRQQATSGDLLAGVPRGVLGHRMRLLRAAFGRAGETMVLTSRIEGAMAGKLLLNLHRGSLLRPKKKRWIWMKVMMAQKCKSQIAQITV